MSETLIPAEQLLQADHVSEAVSDVRDQFTDWVRLVLQVCPGCRAKRRGDGAWIFVPPHKIGELNKKNLCTVWLRKCGLQIRVIPPDIDEYYSPDSKDEYLRGLAMCLEVL